MRGLADAERIRHFMRTLGEGARADGDCYLTGGARAVLLGDLLDVPAMVDGGLIVPERALAYFREIEPELYRYPAVAPRSFRRRVEEAFGSSSNVVV